MTDTSRRRNEGIAKAVKTILATAEDHFDGGWASHPADDMTKVVSEVVESAVAEAVKGEALWWFRQQTAFMRCTRTRDVGELTRLFDLVEKRIEELHRSTSQEGLQDNSKDHGST